METALIDWSRLQFAMTAAYHWLFVPLTLGLGVIVGILETIYYRKGDDFWKKTTQFWMKIFAINFAIGIATGIILEFEFGTNWSNYSWMVGDIFGAPLAIEGILAFFMEATFFAVMFFGWNRVSRRFHLASTWLTAIGACISAFWIIVANGWMQHPVGTEFNPDTVRSEMVSFWAVATNPVAIIKFMHSVFSGWMTAGVFVAGISCWYLLKMRERKFAYASLSVACFVGIIGGVATIFSGDSSGVHVAKYQPMKLAAAEGLEDGGRGAAFSIIPGVEIPGILSFLATHDINGYVPGINDILLGYTDDSGNVEPSVDEKMWRGRRAVSALKLYRQTRDSLPDVAQTYLKVFRDNEKYLGYGYIEKPTDIIPYIPLVYWSFRVMIGLGCYLMLLLLVLQYMSYRTILHRYRWIMKIALCSIPLVYICGEAGWIVAEVGRQPWTIQNLLPVNVAISSLSTEAVKTTFFIFVIVFALFLIAEIGIMVKAVRRGPEIGESWPRVHTEDDQME